MVLKLYGADLSTTTPMVALVLHELNVPFEYHPVDMMKGEHKAPEYVKHQPFGSVPYIDDNGFIMFESRAICRYLCRKYADRGGRELFPFDDLVAFARVEQGMSIETTVFDRAVLAMFVERVYKPMKGVQGSEEAYKEAEEVFGQKLDAYEKILAKQKFMGGDTFTLADLFHIPYATRLKPRTNCDFLENGRPNVARWYKEITSRASWQANKDGIKAISA
ncbi:glutathione S-transferase [Schizophyllum commune]